MRFRMRILFPSQLCMFVATLAVIMVSVGCESGESEELLLKILIESKAPTPETEMGEPEIHRTAEDINLLINGGLEEWIWIAYPLDMPEGWFCHNNTNVRKEHTKLYEGSYSAKMQAQEKGNSAILDQRISVFPGQKIRIRFHYYVEQWKSKGARTYCYFRTGAAENYNISADELRSFYGKGHILCDSWRRKGTYLFSPRFRCLANLRRNYRGPS